MDPLYAAWPAVGDCPILQLNVLLAANSPNYPGLGLRHKDSIQWTPQWLYLCTKNILPIDDLIFDIQNRMQVHKNAI